MFADVEDVLFENTVTIQNSVQLQVIVMTYFKVYVLYVLTFLNCNDNVIVTAHADSSLT